MADDIEVKISVPTAELISDVNKAVKDINTNLKDINTAPVEQGFKNVIQSVKQSESEIESFGQKAKNVIKDISAEAGRSSLLGQGLKALAGGGALFGVGLAAREFEDFSVKIKEATDSVRKGDASFAEASGTLARQVPILGDVVKGYDAIIDAVTGESVALEKANEQAAETNKLIDEAQKKNIANENGEFSFSNKINEINEQNKILSLPQSQRFAAEQYSNVDKQLRSYQDISINPVTGLPEGKQERADRELEEARTALADAQRSKTSNIANINSTINQLEKDRDNPLRYGQGGEQDRRNYDILIQQQKEKLFDAKYDTNYNIGPLRDLYNKAQQTSTDVELDTQELGQALNKNAELKIRDQKKKTGLQPEVPVINIDNSHTVNYGLPHADYGAPNSMPGSNFNN